MKFFKVTVERSSEVDIHVMAEDEQKAREIATDVMNDSSFWDYETGAYASELSKPPVLDKYDELYVGEPNNYETILPEDLEEYLAKLGKDIIPPEIPGQLSFEEQAG